MDPQAYLVLSDAEKSAYLKSLTPEQRAIFLQQVDQHEQGQGDLASATAPQSPDTSTDIPAQPSTPRSPVALTQPLPLADVTLAPENRPDITASMAKIKPRRNLDFSPSRPEIDKLKDRLSSLATVATTFTDMANLSDPANTEIAPSAISQGVTGAISGAAAGPLGFVAGGLLGAVKGALTAGSQREAYEQQEENKRRKLLTGLRVAPSIQETGGIVEVDSDIEIPVQEEEGEVMFFPDGRLVDSMATETHKEMKGKDAKKVTDIIPSGTMIFSNSKKRLIDLSKIKDDIFIITKGHYSEDGNVPGETITMGQIYGDKGKVTPAFMAKKVRRMTPIVEKPVEQYEVDTNQENMISRTQLLRPIMEMQEGVYKKYEYETPQKFEKGGMVKAKKKKRPIPVYETGTDECGAGFHKDSEGNCVPDIMSLIKMDKNAVDAALGTISDPEYRSVVEGSIGNMRAMMSGDVPGATSDWPKVPAEPRLDTPPPPLELNPDGSRKMPPPPPGPTVVNPNIYNPKVSDDTLDRADQIFDNQRQYVDEAYDKSLSESNSLFRSKRFRNLAILASRLGGTGLQNLNVTAQVKGDEHVANMFPEVTESQVEGQINPIRKGQNRVLEAINESGLSGSKVGSAIASTQSRLIDAEGDVRGKALDINQSQKAKRYEKLQQIRDFNRSAEIDAQNATTANRNKMVAEAAGIGAESIKAGGGLRQALSDRRQELDRWRAENQNTITQSEYSNLVKKEELRIRREWDDKVRTGIEDLLKNIFSKT